MGHGLRGVTYAIMSLTAITQLPVPMIRVQVWRADTVLPCTTSPERNDIKAPFRERLHFAM
jgi:hypothetical protein